MFFLSGKGCSEFPKRMLISIGILNFNLECKAIGVIVDGETVKAGDPGRGARYNSLTNYVRWLNSENRNANVNCMAVVISEDGTLDIEISKPRN